MAEDPGEEITDQHRLAQARLAAEAALSARERWRQVSPTDLEATATVWLAGQLADQRAQRRRSRRLSVDYLRLLRAFRTGETLPPPDGEPEAQTSLGELRSRFAATAGSPRTLEPDDAVTVTVDEDFDWPEPDEESDDRRAMVSLIVAGPMRAQRGIDELRAQQQDQRGRLDDADFLADLDAVMRDAGALVAGASDRDALMGGRDLLEEASRADAAVVGWARITDDDPCHFCALMASRGAVYRSEWSARYVGQRRPGGLPPEADRWSPAEFADWETSRGLNRYHDNCHCTVIPVYSREDWLPERSEAFRELYYLSTEGLVGADARRAFRQAIEARRRRARARGVSLS
ncbi:hypothetical protein ACH4D4_04970 [Streptomyces pristinaespiralis]|uniref:VG15 protein n=1 Tax=Streptomyces pristinaespiralis TaxID=38300 RepID=UPI0037B8BC77